MFNIVNGHARKHLSCNVTLVHTQHGHNVIIGKHQLLHSSWSS